MFYNFSGFEPKIIHKLFLDLKDVTCLKIKEVYSNWSYFIMKTSMEEKNNKYCINTF